MGSKKKADKYWGPGKNMQVKPNMFAQRKKRVKPQADNHRKQDLVNHPAHYNAGRIEVIEAIEDWALDYHRGNAVKYIARAGKKDPSKTIEDLKKAIWYLNRRVELLSAAGEGREARRPNDTKI